MITWYNGIYIYIRLLFFAEQGNLKGEDVAQHVLSILQDSDLCHVFASDHSNMLYKHILTVRKYWAEIQSKTWNRKNIP